MKETAADNRERKREEGGGRRDEGEEREVGGEEGGDRWAAKEEHGNMTFIAQTKSLDALSPK